MKEKLAIEYLSVETVIPYARNARTHSREQIKQIAKSIHAFGFINPIIIDADGMIVAGHARALAAKEMGLSLVPAIRVDYLSEAEKRAYILADNKLAENAGWDQNLLKIELDYLSQIDINFDVDLTGFSVGEIDLILSAVHEEAEEDILLPIPASEDTVTSRGDLWQLGPHRLICGDCRGTHLINQLMGTDVARMMITDPPYNVAINGHVCGLGQNKHADFAMACGEMSEDEFTVFLTACLSQLARVCSSGSLHYIFMDWRHMSELQKAGLEVYNDLINLCVWAKTNGGMGSLYRSQHELVFVFKKGTDPHLNNVELGKHGRYRTNLWSYPGVNAFSKNRSEELAFHPTVKPIQMIADAIMDVTQRGDIVLDGFLGSGTTLLAAEQTGRICFGIEYEPRYVDLAIRRWMEATGKAAVLVASGQTFAQLSALKRAYTQPLGKIDPTYSGVNP